VGQKVNHGFGLGPCGATRFILGGEMVFSKELPCDPKIGKVYKKALVVILLFFKYWNIQILA
jgi:hypothetical protein